MIKLSHQFRATLRQIYPPNWFFLGLIIGVGPIRQTGPLQEHPPPLPSARARDVVEHGEETSVSHLDSSTSCPSRKMYLFQLKMDFQICYEAFKGHLTFAMSIESEKHSALQRRDGGHARQPPTLLPRQAGQRDYSLTHHCKAAGPDSLWVMVFNIRGLIPV